MENAMPPPKAPEEILPEEVIKNHLNTNQIRNGIND